jgi:hypothetical protein
LRERARERMLYRAGDTETSPTTTQADDPRPAR